MPKTNTHNTNEAEVRPGMPNNTTENPQGSHSSATQNNAYMEAIRQARAASDDNYIDDFGDEYIDDGSDDDIDADGKPRVRSEASTDDLVKLAIHGLQEKKGKQIVSLDLRQLEDTVTDAFVVVHGDSTTQVRALADSVDDEIFKATGERPWHTEGLHNAQWVVLDYVSVVVHVFLEETRDFYGIEELWNDAIVVEHADY